MAETSDTNPQPAQTQGEASPKAEEKSPPAFTDDQQRMIDEIISKRVGEVKAKHDNEVRALKDQHRRELERAAMAEEERLKAEREDELNALKKRAEEAERSLRLADARSMAVQAGLPADLAPTLIGEDEEATRRNIAMVRKAVDELAGKLYAERVGKGTPQAPARGKGGVDEDRMRAVMGLPPRGKE